MWDKIEYSAGTTADGFARLGTNREILSWPGLNPQVRTEADEEDAQRRLKKEREELRASVFAERDRQRRITAEVRAKQEALFKQDWSEHVSDEQVQRCAEKDKNRQAMEWIQGVQDINAYCDQRNAELFGRNIAMQRLSSLEANGQQHLSSHI